MVVLILVLMEDTLREAEVINDLKSRGYVLILVLMEDTLRDIRVITKIVEG